MMQVHIMNNDGHTPSDLIENSTGFYLMVSQHSIFYPYTHTTHLNVKAVKLLQTNRIYILMP
jgi:hypothetical protein